MVTHFKYNTLVTVVSKPQTEWALLSYRVPREPSTPRIAVWRQLRDLGVAKVGDGLVALPASPRNTERLQWVAGKVIEADGEAIVWNATTLAKRDTKQLMASMEEARNEEYRALLADVAADPSPNKRTIDRWRRAWRAIDKRDHSNASEREPTRAAIAERAAQVAGKKSELADDASELSS